VCFFFAVPEILYAAENSSGSDGGHDSLALVFFFVAVMLLFAGVGALAKKIGQPPVLGELVMGIVLGILAFVPGLGIIDTLKHHNFIIALAELGVIILLFRTGLETNVKEMLQVGPRAFFVACLGVVLPFIGGYFVSSLIFPESMIIGTLSFATFLFVGATLTATSVGITARVFSDLGFSKSKESKIVLGAAVIDDVLGLIFLAVVSGIVSSLAVGEALSTSEILGLAGRLTVVSFGFIAGLIILGQFIAPKIGKFFAGISTGVGMKVILALFFCLTGAYGSSLIGLASMVGAFAAGLFLDPVHFSSFGSPDISKKVKSWRGYVSDPSVGKDMEETAHRQEHTHVEDLIDTIALFLVPVFFVYTGMQVDISVFANINILWIALVITAVAFIGKIASGLVAGSGVNKKIVGFGMVPRGEVGLIFVNEGKKLGVVNEEVFAVAIIVVIVSTLLTPIFLNYLIKKKS